MNKIDIIQRLLDERHITAREALVLMEKEVEYIPQRWYPWYSQPINYELFNPSYVTGDYAPQVPFTVSEN